MLTHSRRWWPVLAVVLSLLVQAAPLRAEEKPFDLREVERWLARPGVKLLAVDFYSQNCPPCARDMPKWQKLHEKYFARGFRFALVKVQEEGACITLPAGFKPDAEHCDFEGSVAASWSVKSFPKSFLWNWRGEKLVDHGTFEDAATAVEKYFANEPRILVEAEGPEGAALRDDLRAELLAQSKFDVLPSAKEQAELSRLKAQVVKNKAYSEKEQCTLGEALPPNSRLSATFSKDRLGLVLYNLQTGCIVAQQHSNAGGARAAAVKEAVAGLVQALAGEAQSPSGGAAKTKPAPPKATGPQISGGEFEESQAVGGPRSRKGAVTAALARLSIKATPNEASILVSGPNKFFDSATGKWSREDLRPGTYSVKVEAAGYEVQQKSYTLEPDDDKPDKITLLRLGVLEVVGTPEKAKVEISGPDGPIKPLGLPVTIQDAQRGYYSIKVSKPGYEEESFSAKIEAGLKTTVPVALKTPGSLEITGEPAGAKVEVNGPNGYHDEGGFPFVIEGAWRGNYSVKVSREGYADVEKRVEVVPGETKREKITLEKKTAVAESSPEPKNDSSSGAPANAKKNENGFWMRYLFGGGFGFYKLSGEIPVHHKGTTYTILPGKNYSGGGGFSAILGEHFKNGLTVGGVLGMSAVSDKHTHVWGSSEKVGYMLNFLLGVDLGYLSKEGFIVTATPGLALQSLKIELRDDPTSDSSKKNSVYSDVLVGPSLSLVVGKEWNRFIGVALVSTYTYTVHGSAKINGLTEYACVSMSIW